MRKALAILLVPLLFLVLFFTSQSFIGLKPSTDQNKPVETHPVLIVDFDGDKKLSEQELLDSNDAVLLVTTSDKDKMDLSDNLFNSVTALQNMNLTEDYKVDSNEEVYNNFTLMFFQDEDKERKYMSLKEAKIKELIFFQTAIKNLDQISAGKGNNLVGYAVEGNGKHAKKVEIRVIPVSIN